MRCSVHMVLVLSEGEHLPKTTRSFVEPGTGGATIK